MTIKLLSIAIPTFNRGSLLHECLVSLCEAIKECDDEVEIYVFDNASTDDTETRMTQWLLDYPFVHYSRNDANRGPEYNIRRAYVEPSSTYVWLMGDDDLPAPGALARILSELHSDSSLGGIYLNQSNIDLSGTSSSPIIQT